MPATITTILILATLVEALVEYLIRPLVKPPAPPVGAPGPDPSAPATSPDVALAAGADPTGTPSPAPPLSPSPPPPLPAHTADLVLRYSAAAVGLALCLIYRADLLALLGLTCSVPYAGEAITGLLLGRGANYIHDFGNRWLAWPAAL